MKIQDVNVQTLIDLGLNSSEARVYTALYETGTAKATTISKASRVPRPDVYRTLSKLNELGLVEKLISHPLRFRPIPIETGVAILLELKSKKYHELKSKSASLIYRLNKKNICHDSYHESQFVLIPSTEVLVKRLTKTIEKTQTSIDVSTSWKRFKVVCYRLGETLEKAWCRGVKGRLVMERPEEPVLDFVKISWKSPYAKIKYINSHPRTVMAIYDNKEVFIYIKPKADLTKSPALWSNNPSLVAMAEDCFETLWNTAQELPKHSTDDNQT